MNDFSADVRLAREGNTEAFARLYATVYEDLYHIALYSLRSPDDAADTVSDTCPPDVAASFGSHPPLNVPRAAAGRFWTVIGSVYFFTVPPVDLSVTLTFVGTGLPFFTVDATDGTPIIAPSDLL